MQKNLYELLDVAPSADADAIRTAYRRQMTLYHPDKVTALGPALRVVAEEQTKAINAAYATLSNPTSRAAYDRSLKTEEAPRPPPRPTPPPPPSRPSQRERAAAPPPPRLLKWYSRPLFGFSERVAVVTLGVLGCLLLIAFCGMISQFSGEPDAGVPIFLAGGLLGVFFIFSEAIRKTRRWRGFGPRMAAYGIRLLLIFLASLIVFAAIALRSRPEIQKFTVTPILALVTIAASLLVLAKTIIPDRVDRLLAKFKR